MNKTTLIGLLASTLLLFTGCATKPSIAYELSPEVNVSSFETFALMPLPKRVQGGRIDAVEHYGPAGQAALREALIAKGYTETDLESADFAIHVKAAVTPTLNVSQWGYTTGNYAGTDYWGTSSYYDVVADVDVRPDDHAIVILEIFENDQKTLAWCGWLIDRTKKHRMPVAEFQALMTELVAGFPAK